ncbi:transmembrane protein, putative (macronuclear) [Tetrahymena thermophila SB210]|uniref:Transmembrane protein, putative n=1 Tax=Tetrahymena thermophila (strain SB210) TaxID=312017 RepID=Q22SF9_TETTS|nr:transmembrane protein, putative [Tetrahymena thermophila SB210]EAR87813.3 transmembrane protein, putative [Tetrahymena thermophila SB210]|eukprot:XP_001008058.3 transmembrane protein, putative [Tetrahymena thermophila SB210]
MNYYTIGTSPYIMVQMDNNNQQINSQQGPGIIAGYWYQFGFGFKQSLNIYYSIWQGYPQGGLVYPTFQQSNFQFRSDITQLTLCIICPPLENKFTQFVGQYSSIKMITGFYPPDTAKLIINENNMNDQLLRSAFFINDNLTNYTKKQYQPLTTDLIINCYNSTKFYFDGVCIDPSQCQNIVYFQTSQFGSVNSVFYNSVKLKCDVCQDYCLNCDNQSNCLQCKSGYVLDTTNNICKRCPVNSFYNSLNSLCVSNCPNGYQKDYINQLCVQNFNPFYILLNPLLYPRNFIQNDGFTLMDTNLQIQPDQYTQCWLENQSFGPYTILGGQNNLNSNKINKKILNLPKNFQKIITFQGLIYNNGQQGDFILEVNNNLVTLSSFTKIFTNYQLCDDNQQVNYYQLTYIINDSTTSLDINISSNKNGWGIRNFAMNITKCHSTCNDCTTDGNPWSCTTCQIQQTSILINQNCACSKGQYAQFQNCYSSPCYNCSNCPPNCLSCEDQTGKCTSCATGYSIQNGLCIINSSCSNQYSQDPGSSYCIRAKDQGMSFFVQDRIQLDLQFWYYTGLPEQFRQCYNRKYAPYIYGTQSVSLIMQLPQYQNYHYQVGFQFTAMNVDNFAAVDYMSYYIDNNLVKKANYRSNTTVSLCEDINYGENQVPEQIFQLKKDTNLNFTIGAYLPNSKWFTLNDLTIYYQRCHASCTNCLNGSTCTSCIQNSQPNAALGNFCYCNDGFYFTYDWNTSSGLCLPCNSFCKTCNGPSITDCITCQESYKVVNNICVNACQVNQFWDFNLHQCVNCSDCCSSCNGTSNSQCLSCQDPIMTLNSNVCKFNSDKNTCNSCNTNVSNSLCGGTQINHDYCLTKGWLSYNSNTCVNCFTADSNGNCGGSSIYNQLCNKYGYYYSSTLSQCLSCSQAFGVNCGDPSISNVCKQNRWMYQSLSTCISCNLQQSPLCCDATCKTCNGSSSNNCLSCFGSMVLFNNSCLDKCPNGYSYNSSQNNCQNCPVFIGVPECNNCASDCQTCSASTISQCKTCYGSRQLNAATNRCDCKDQEDQRMFFYECSMNNQAVLNIELSNQGPQMTIDFGKILADIPNYPTQTNSTTICKLLFSQAELQKIGFNSACQIQFNLVNIALDNTATIIQGDTLNFLPNILKFKINSSSYIDTFLNNIVYQQPPQNTGVVFNFKKIENSCNDYKITLDKVQNDSGRGFQSITWTLLNPTANQDDVQIQNILTQASNQSLLNITIPKGVITLNTQKSIQASYKLKNTYSASQQFVFQVQTFKSIASVLSSNMIIPYFRYLEFNLNLSYSIQYCDNYGNSLNTNDPIDITITSPQTSQISNQIKSNTQNQIVQIIQAYSFPPNSNNQINVQLQLSSDQSVTNMQQVSFSTVPPKLIVKINGGNQRIDYKSNLNLNANLRDLDVQDPNADQGITLVWSCTDPSDPTKQCYDQNAKPFNFNQINPSIPPSTFSPYTVIRVQAQANKDTRSSLDFIIVLFTEFDLPLLDISLNLLDPQGLTVNLNEEIFATLNYNTTVNTDILSFSTVFNTTININVTSSNMNEANYIQAIDSAINNNKLTNQQIISELSLFAEDLSLRTDLISSDQINQKKIQILEKLKQLILLLPSSSTFSSLSNKAIASLMPTIKLTLDQQNSQLTSLQSALSEDWSQVPYQNLSVAEKSIKNQLIFDFFKIIDSMANSSQSSNSTSQNLQIDISNKLGEKMNYNSLPNEDPKIFQGNSIKIQSQQVTEKNLCNYLFCSNFQPSETQTKSIIYNIAYKTYQQNPYLDDPSFQNLTQQIKQNIGNQTIASFPVINPSILSSSQNPSQNSIINQSSAMHNFQGAQLGKERLACYTKNKNQWTQSGCKLVFNSKNNQYTCFCESLGPTTIANDLQALIQNKNLQTAFSEQGFENISHFSDFYKYIAFWLIVCKTIGFILLYIKGNHLDKKFIKYQNKQVTSNFNQRQVIPLPLNLKSIKESNQNIIQSQKQQNENNSPFSVDQTKIQSQRKTRKRFFYSQNQIKEEQHHVQKKNKLIIQQIEYSNQQKNTKEIEEIKLEQKESSLQNFEDSSTPRKVEEQFAKADNKSIFSKHQIKNVFLENGNQIKNESKYEDQQCESLKKIPSIDYLCKEQAVQFETKENHSIQNSTPNTQRPQIIQKERLVLSYPKKQQIYEQ